MKKQTLMLLILLSAITIACSKDESSKTDVTAPEISLLAPDSISEYSIGSNLPVVADITENDALHEIMVEITNLTKGQVVFRTHTHNHSRSVLYETSMHIGDTTSNQKYAVKVIATDHSGNTSSREIITLIKE